MIAHAPVFNSYRTDSELGSRLAAISARKQLDAYVGLQINGRRLFAAAARGIQIDPAQATDHLVPAACLAKPITATLLAEAAAQHHLHWSDEIGDVLNLAGPGKARLAGIELRSLLNHTHGLDASSLAQVPRTRDGFVHVEALCDQLPVVPLSPPGRLYSYSNAGAWFAGALLERLQGLPYSQLLYNRCLWPEGPDSERAHAGCVCPATGEDLGLTVFQWLAFLDFHLRDPQAVHGPLAGSGDVLARALESLRANPVLLPGWSPSEQGACLGWKYYGPGWFGHNSNVAGSSALLRFNPQQNIAIVVQASDDGAFIVLAGLFGTALPEFMNLRPPRLLSAAASAVVRTDRYTGTYVLAQSRLGIEAHPGGTLCLTVETQSSRAPGASRLLRAAAGEMFMPEPRNDPEFPFVQFVEQQGTRRFGYLWNGKQLWRRE